MHKRCWIYVTSLSLLVCKNVEFKEKLDLNLSAYEIIKDVIYFSLP
jgi:hypothetical protein